MHKHIKFGLSWIPLIGALAWIATLAALLIAWLVEGHPRYRNTEAKFVYISDVGGHIKPLFIAGACVTVAFYIASLLADHFFRYNTEHRRLPGFVRRVEVVSSILVVIFGILGSAFLVLLTIFDVFNHQQAHWVFTGLFIIGIAISGLFNCVEVAYLRKDYPHFKRLTTSAIIKISLLAVAVAFAIAMVVLMTTCSITATTEEGHCDRAHSTAAGFEWSIALIFALYIGTYTIDLREHYFKSIAAPADAALAQAYANTAVPKDSLNARYPFDGRQAGAAAV